MIYPFFKRIFDITFSTIGIIILIPTALIIKIIYVLDGDTKSIFYCHKRIGKNGKIFKLYKFRSMVYNSDEILKELLKNDKYKKEWKTNHKIKNDPRITKIGKILRTTSIDELPQIINVLKGDMSIIGPRPLIPGELDAYKGNHNIYESIRPGITGWWACNGRSNINNQERLNLEYFYCKNYNLLLDIKCIFKTIFTVIFKIGAM